MSDRTTLLLLITALFVPFGKFIRADYFACRVYEVAECPCGSTGTTVTIAVPRCQLEDEAQAAGSCVPCSLEEIIPNPCYQFANCLTCDASTGGCSSCPSGKSGPTCELDQRASKSDNNNAQAYETDQGQGIYPAFVPIEEPPLGYDAQYAEAVANGVAVAAPYGSDESQEQAVPEASLYGGEPEIVEDLPNVPAVYENMGGEETPAEENLPDYSNFLRKKYRRPKLGGVGSFHAVHAREEHNSAEKREAEGLGRFPVEVTILPGESIRNNRHLRGLSECYFPAHMDTAKISCKIWPKYTRCNVTCIWGYTLSTGRESSLKCRNEENVWKPHGFEECKPYVDCSLKLKSPGSLNCVYNRMSEPISCDVACDEYDETPATSKKEYFCNLDGSFSPSLPFCVEKVHTVNTVSAP